ncbi:MULTISPECIES: thioesterase II family protein [Streptomyces]|uniref:Alpha/beta fold hydrolase n=1 Tax=Streptomyces doebereineriae TaxID=3075528 RepID=A0ABU2VB32_9ACTN|nr:alpha/beta fold hydrolase [Streptomyces sp. DSM 41640]MDT0482748.1 alpha/beta fold hydrolase [Streptomyces sp. DSM 41640]
MTWLRDWSHSEHVAVRVLCLPGAGTAAHTFRRWSQLLSADIGVLAVELPGRGSRMGEPAVHSMEEILRPLSEEVAALTDRPLVIFGHSMGATVGAELCRALGRERGFTPDLMIAAACEAPRLTPRKDYARWLTEEGVRDFLRYMGGTPPELLADEDYMRMLVPALRADLTVLATRPPAEDRPLGCPVRVYLGRSDSGVRPDRAAHWRAESNGDFATYTFASGHFFVQDNVTEVLARLSADVADLLGAVATPTPAHRPEYRPRQR